MKPIHSVHIGGLVRQVALSPEAGHVVAICDGDPNVYTLARSGDQLGQPTSRKSDRDGALFVLVGIPPFSAQSHRFPSLAFEYEFGDPNGEDLLEPWMYPSGPGFPLCGSVVFRPSATRYLVPYFDGSIAAINGDDGTFEQSIMGHEGRRVL